MLARAGAALRGVVALHGILSAPVPAQRDAVVSKVLVLHGDADSVAPAESAIDFQEEMRWPARTGRSIFTVMRSTALRAKELPATEHPKLSYIHKRKPDRGKRRSSSYERYLNKGYSDDAVTRIGRLGPDRPYPPEAAVGLVPRSAYVGTHLRQLADG
jgi:hypothetical protein